MEKKKLKNANVVTVDGDDDDEEEEVKTSYPKMEKQQEVAKCCNCRTLENAQLCAHKSRNMKEKQIVSTFQCEKNHKHESNLLCVLNKIKHMRSLFGTGY